MNKIIIAFAATAALAGYAKRPDAIVQADIPMAAYTNLSCQALAVELKKEQVKLDGLSKQQISAANGDAFGVFLVGVSIGSVAGGDKEGDVAVSKGKISAMQSAGIEQGLQAARLMAGLAGCTGATFDGVELRARRMAAFAVHMSRLRAPHACFASRLSTWNEFARWVSESGARMR